MFEFSDDDAIAPEAFAEDQEFRPLVFTFNTGAKQKVWKDRRNLDRSMFERIFANFREDDNKDGHCFVPGGIIGTERKKEAIEFIDALVYDVDGRQTKQQIDECTEKAGVYAVVYSTHSHMTTETPIGVDKYYKWVNRVGMTAKPRPDIEDMKAYCADNKKDHLNIKGVTIEVTSEGQVFMLEHDPVPKLRVVFPLAKRIVLAELALGNQRAIESYKSVYHGVGQALGFDYDTSCEDPSRLFYFPSCKPGAEHSALAYRWDEDDPPLLDWEAYQRARQEEANNTDKKGQKQDKSGSRHRCSLKAVADKSGRKINLLDWDKQAKLTFNIEEVLSARLPAEMIGAKRDNGGFHIQCPNEEQHTKPGGSGTFCVNSNGEMPWTIYCCHDSCKSAGQTRLDRLADLIVAGYVTAEDLEDRKFGGASLQQWFELPVSGGFVVPLGQLDLALAAMNEQWAVIKIGNKTRFMTIKHDGTLEFLDKTSMMVLFESAYYEVEKDDEIKLYPFLPRWRSWVKRRQYSGYGFFPAPVDHRDACPEGHYNAYRGFSVEPQKGTWKRMLGHLYRNVCRRDRHHFRWLIAWLAQMVQQPHIKPGTHVVMRGKEGVGKSKLGEWIIRLFGPNAMPITSASRLAGRFNAHMEALLFGLVEEAIWAGDKTAEGSLKALATAEELDYERKGLDPVRGRNYTRLMFASNEDWVVPSASGGRRWFVIEVGDEHEKDNEYFKALDDEMNAGGLSAMLYDLQRHDFSAVNVREVPVTEWLVDQRLHSYDTKKRWWRDVLVQGGFRIDDGIGAEFVAIGETFTTVAKEDVFRSARPHFGTERRKATESDVGTFLSKMLKDVVGFGEGPRVGNRSGGRTRTYNFPPLFALREAWKEATGEDIEHGAIMPSHAAACDAERENLTKEPFGKETTLPQEALDIVKAVITTFRSRGVFDPAQLQAAIDEALTAAGYPPNETVRSSRRSAA